MVEISVRPQSAIAIPPYRPHNESPQGKPSRSEIWGSLGHEARVANGKFPQAYLAQGILLAHKMVELSQRGAAWGELLERKATPEIVEELTDARARAHNAYGIHTTVERLDEIASVWARGIDYTTVLLRTLGSMAYTQKHWWFSKAPASTEELLTEVFSNPTKYPVAGIRLMLEGAYQTLLSPDIKKKSNSYTHKITEFMQKYDPKVYDDQPIPEGYEDERLVLLDRLNKELHEVGFKVKGGMVSAVRGKNPVDKATKRLAKKIDNTWPHLIFGPFSVYDIDPLRSNKKKALEASQQVESTQAGVDS